MNALTPSHAAGHSKRSTKACRLDWIPRQLIHQTELFGFYVRLFYLEEDDSFHLRWLLPHDGSRGCGIKGDKYYVNADDCFASMKYCIEELEKAQPDLVTQVEFAVESACGKVSELLKRVNNSTKQNGHRRIA